MDNMYPIRQSAYYILLSVLLLIFSSTCYASFTKTKIAVLDFELHGNKFQTESMGAIVSEWFITSLVKDGRFDVVERAMLNKIITEQKLGITGIIDNQSASKIGKILGVKVVITGSVLKLEDTIEINSRIINVENGSIITAENIKSSIHADLQLQIAKLTEKIVKNFPLTGYIVKRNDTSVFIDLGKFAGLKTGMKFLVYKEGNVIKHPKTGEVLDVEQVVSGTIQITEVNKTLSEGVILEEDDEKIAYGQHVKSIGPSKPNLREEIIESNRNLSESDNREISQQLSRLTVFATPSDARIRILNIQPKYKSGIELTEGAYHLEISKYGYTTNTQWVTLAPGQDTAVTIELNLRPHQKTTKTTYSNNSADSILAQKLQSNNLKQVIAAAKTITKQRGNPTSPNIYDLVEERLLKDYRKKSGRSHTDAMAWLCKALASSHNSKYKQTLQTVVDNSSSVKLTIYASKSLYTL